MPAKGIFRCFSSGNAGDIFRFVQLQENVAFVDAVEMVANRFNIPIEYEKTARREARPHARKSLFDLHELVCNFFVENFLAPGEIGEKVREYWTEERKFSLDVAAENGIGFGGGGDSSLVKKILAAKFTPEAMAASGIFYHRENETDPHRYTSRFHARLTIPIRDIQGRIVGFSARVIPGIGGKNELSDAKYINSPETEIFHKGSLLFGLNRARQHLSLGEPVWMVEGQFDVLRCWSNGIGAAVAPQGTAITDAQLSALRRYTVHLHCMLDGDGAGLKAAERMLPMAMAAGLDVKFFIFPDGSDPDSYFREDFEARFKSLFASGKTGIQFLAWRFLPNGIPITAQEKAEALKKIYEVIAVADSSVARESYLTELVDAANLDRNAVFQDFKSFLTRRKFAGAPSAISGEKTVKTQKKLSSAEDQLLAIVLSDSKIAAEVAQFFERPFLQNLSSSGGKILLKVLNEVKNDVRFGMHILDDLQLFSDGERNLACALVADLSEDCECTIVANMCLKKLHANFIGGEIDKTNGEFRKISLDEDCSIKNLQRRRLDLREMLKHPPQIFCSGTQ
jgi:DNA primase